MARASEGTGDSEVTGRFVATLGFTPLAATVASGFAVAGLFA